VCQTGKEDVDACGRKYKLIPESLLVSHDELIFRESFSDCFADLLEEVSLAFDCDTAVVAELRTFGDEVVEIHHIELCVIDDLLEVFTLFHCDIVIQGVLTRLARQGSQAYAKTISLRAKADEVILCVCKGQRTSTCVLEVEVDYKDVCLDRMVDTIM
jgi:hypothetical protein